jgi:hypothetical protein
VAETRNEGALDLLPDMPPVKAAKAAEIKRRNNTGEKSAKGQKTLRLSTAQIGLSPGSRGPPLMPFDYLVPERLARAGPLVGGSGSLASLPTASSSTGWRAASIRAGLATWSGSSRPSRCSPRRSPDLPALPPTGGDGSDVLRLAIPQRHAATETARRRPATADGPGPRDTARRGRTRPVVRYPAGPPSRTRSRRAARPGCVDAPGPTGGDRPPP